MGIFKGPRFDVNQSIRNGSMDSKIYESLAVKELTMIDSFRIENKHPVSNVNLKPFNNQIMIRRRKPSHLQVIEGDPSL